MGIPEATVNESTIPVYFDTSLAYASALAMQLSNRGSSISVKNAPIRLGVFRHRQRCNSFYDSNKYSTISNTFSQDLQMHDMKSLENAGERVELPFIEDREWRDTPGLRDIVSAHLSQKRVSILNPYY